MKQDRFLLGLLAGIGALIIIALVLFFVRQDTQTYQSDDTPEGVVHNYALALYQRDYQRAYSYLADKPYKPSYETFREAFLNGYVTPQSAGLEVGATQMEGNAASVEVRLIYGQSDPFSSSYTNTEFALLTLQDGAWKLTQMPYTLWAYDWYQQPYDEKQAP